MKRNRTMACAMGLLIAAASVITSCGKDDESPAQYDVQISESFLPVSITLDKQGDPYVLQVCRDLNMKTVVVQNANELPRDPIGFSSAYTGLDYSTSTLILTYRANTWGIDTYSNKFVRNNAEDTYDWYLTLGSSEYDKDESETVTFTRFAIEVPRLPKNSDVRVWWSLSSSGWGGGWD